MLYIAIFLSALLLVAVNVSARKPDRPVVKTSLRCLGLSLASFFCFFFPPVAVQAALLFAVSCVWVSFNWTPRRYLDLSCGATAVAYGLFIPYAIQKESEVSRSEKQFPYESMEGRAPPAMETSGPISISGTARLNDLEKAIDGDIHALQRSIELRNLHEYAVVNFVNAPGFGMGRMADLNPNERELNQGLRTEPAPLQPPNPAYSPNEIANPPIPSSEHWGRIHQDGVLDFLHPGGFGYVKDRQHVAGFQSHRFSKVPAPILTGDSRQPTKWEVVRLELVSLLMHKEPGVYVSDRLPQMDALKGVPIRALDAFENEGLTAIRKGEDLFVRQDRMLGSIRSTRQCIQCHGGERGVLLGGFTYRIRPTTK